MRGAAADSDVDRDDGPQSNSGGLLRRLGGTFMEVESNHTWDRVKLRVPLARRKQRSVVLHTNQSPVLAEFLYNKHKGPPGT